MKLQVLLLTTKCTKQTKVLALILVFVLFVASNLSVSLYYNAPVNLEDHYRYSYEYYLSNNSSTVAANTPLPRKQTGFHLLTSNASSTISVAAIEKLNNKRKRIRPSVTLLRKHNNTERTKTSLMKSSTLTSNQHLHNNNNINNNNNNNVSECYMDPPVPSFIIAGAQKSGTSALYYLLEALDDMLPSLAFEAHFFDARGELDRDASALTPQGICQARQNYRKFFDTPKLQRSSSSATASVNNNKKTILSFEKTPVYLCRPVVPALIHKIVPWTKIVVLLRNPVDRAYSAFKMLWERTVQEGQLQDFETLINKNIRMLRRRGLTKAPLLKQYLQQRQPQQQQQQQPHTNNNNNNNNNNSTTTTTNEYDYDFSLNTDLPHSRRNQPGVLEQILPRGFYAVQLRNWLKYFPLGTALKVVRYEDFQQNPSAVLNDILAFVGAQHPHNLSEHVLQEQYQPKRYTQRRQAAALSHRTQEFLELFFAPYNDELADLLGEEWRGVW